MKFTTLAVGLTAGFAAAAPLPATEKMPLKCTADEVIKKFCHPLETFHGPPQSRCRAWCEPVVISPRDAEVHQALFDPTFHQHEENIKWQAEREKVIKKAKKAEGGKRKKGDFPHIDDMFH